MDSEEQVIQTADLQIGTCLSFDLTDTQGNFLHKAGMPITQRLLDRLAAKNVHTVTVLGETLLDKYNARDLLFQSYPPELIASIESAISEAERGIESFIDKIVAAGEVDSEQVVASIDSFVALAQHDASATLAVILNRSAVTQQFKSKLVSRATTLSLLSVATSVVLEYSNEDSVQVGIVGLLHDCSLLLHPEWFDEKGVLKKDSQLIEEFRNHSLESVEILRDISGIDDQVLEAIAQVHEQHDGSGFPNGYAGDQILGSASIVNIVDAFLSLVSPASGEAPIFASDATAYLCHHAGKGRFKPQVVKAFICSLSIYPIGSTVELDDESVAVVIKSNHVNPLEPIVRILDSTGRVSDLGIANRKIVKAVSPQGLGLRRITKTMLDQILWRHDMELDKVAS